MTTFDEVDEVLFRIHARVMVDGLYVNYVPADGAAPAWAATVGLLDLGHPEVVVFGLGVAATTDALQHLFDEIEYGIRRPVGRTRRPRDLGCPPHTVRLLPVADEHWDCGGDHRLCLAAGYHGALGRPRAALRAVQLVWATPRGTFPWHARATEADRRRQPLLDRGPIGGSR